MSNLLDKASIVLTPTAYDNGKVLCVKPSDGSGDFDFSRNSAATRVNAQGLVENVQILSGNVVQNGNFSQIGSEVITNGDFATDSDWNKGSSTTISNGEASFNGVSSYVYQDILTIGKTYTCSVSVKDWVSGAAFSVGSGPTGSGTIYSNITRQSNTTTTFTFTAVSTILGIGSRSFNIVGSIDNVSVKEVLQDWSAKDGTMTLSDSGALLFDNSSGNGLGGAFQNAGLVTGKKYQMIATMQLLTGVSNGSFNLFTSTSIGTGQSTVYNGSVLVVGGAAVTETFTFTPASGDVSIQLYCDEPNATYTIDNISVVEIVDDTNLPRINYEGFSYQNALGSELVTNGDFSNGLANWVVDDGTSWTNVNDAAFCDGNNGLIKQSFTSAQGKVYKVTFDSVANGGGLLGVRVGSGGYDWSLYTTGTHTIYLTAGSFNTQGVMFYATAGWTGSIDNVSVKEVLGQEVVPDSGCGSWLFEPQSTNLITYSEDFSDASWTNTYTLTPNSVISPSGELNAFKITSGTVNGALRASVTVSINTDYIFSFYVKRGTASEMKYRVYDLGNGINILAQTSYYSQTNLDNWVRIEVPFTTSATTTYVGVYIDSDSQGNGDFYIWGAQLEQQSYATSYIPTDGTTVTRNRDLCTNGGSVSTINSTEGVLYAEIAALSNSLNWRQMSISDGTGANRVTIAYNFDSNRIAAQYRVGNVPVSDITYSVSDETDFNKIAFRYSQDNFSLWINGIKVREGLSGDVAPANTFDRFNFTGGDIVSDPFFGKTKCLAVWKEALTDAELTALTTI